MPARARHRGTAETSTDESWLRPSLGAHRPPARARLIVVLHFAARGPGFAQESAGGRPRLETPSRHWMAAAVTAHIPTPWPPGARRRGRQARGTCSSDPLTRPRL